MYSIWNSTHSHVPAWLGRGFGGEWIHVYESLDYSPETITALLIGYTPIQHKKLKKNSFPLSDIRNTIGYAQSLGGAGSERNNLSKVDKSRTQINIK